MAFQDLSNAHKGAIIPHMILQEVLSLNTYSYHKPYFWVRDKVQASAEVDLVYQYHDQIIPIEIKSGPTGKLKSLHQFIEQAGHPYAVRMYAGNFCIEEHQTPVRRKSYLLMNLPYYLGTRLPAYIDYFMSNY